MIELAKALKVHPEVELWADDPAARPDLASFCTATGAQASDAGSEGVLLKVLVRRR